VFATLLRQRLPRVHDHLSEDLGYAGVADLFAPLFSRCAVGWLGWHEPTARLWDCLVLEGPKALHRAGIALLATFEGTTLACAHPAALPRLLDGRAAQALGRPGREGALVAAMHRRGVVGGLPAAQLAALRAAARAEVAARAEDRRRRMQEILG
jgi:hypothetical protein